MVVVLVVVPVNGVSNLLMFVWIRESEGLKRIKKIEAGNCKSLLLLNGVEWWCQVFLSRERIKANPWLPLKMFSIT